MARFGAFLTPKFTPKRAVSCATRHLDKNPKQLYIENSLDGW